MVNTNDCLLMLDGLKTYFPVRQGLLRRTVGHIRAVDGVSFTIGRGQTFGLVGETGCGKTTVARTIARLVPATAGRVVFDGIDVLSADKSKLRQLRRDISLIFQDPFASLNPRMTVGGIIAEPLKVHGAARNRRDGDLIAQVAELLCKVGLSSDHINRYPHEFSGGQRQRIGIARALAVQPKLVICDEPVSSLDISIAAQILNLLKDLQEDRGLTYLFIAHDLAVVDFFCDVVAVMYMGRIVEQAPAKELHRGPLHPYTRVLMSAIPQVRSSLPQPRDFDTLRLRGGDVIPAIAGIGRIVVPSGEPLTPSAQSAGCTFYPRCPLAQSDCLAKMPPLEEKDSRPGHLVACWRC